MTAKMNRAVVTARVALVTMIEERITSLRWICVFSALALRSLLPCLLGIAKHELGLFEKVNFVIPNIARAAGLRNTTFCAVKLQYAVAWQVYCAYKPLRKHTESIVCFQIEGSKNNENW